MKNLSYRVLSFIAAVLMSVCLWSFSSVMLEAPKNTPHLESLQIAITFLILPLSIAITFITRLLCKITWKHLGLAFLASLLFTQAWGFHSIPIVSGAFAILSFLALYFSVSTDLKNWLSLHKKTKS